MPHKAAMSRVLLLSLLPHVTRNHKIDKHGNRRNPRRELEGVCRAEWAPIREHAGSCDCNNGQTSRTLKTVVTRHADRTTCDSPWRHSHVQAADQRRRRARSPILLMSRRYRVMRPCVMRLVSRACLHKKRRCGLTEDWLVITAGQSDKPRRVADQPEITSFAARRFARWLNSLDIYCHNLTDSGRSKRSTRSIDDSAASMSTLQATAPAPAKR